MNDSVVYISYLGIALISAITGAHLLIYRNSKNIKTKCQNCGSKRLRFYELSAVSSSSGRPNYSVYICADCENKIYKKIG